MNRQIQILVAVMLLSISSLTYAYTTSELQAMSAQINKDLPKTVDDMTQLINTSVTGTTFNFRYKVNKSSLDVNIKKLESEMAAQIKDGACKNPGELSLLNSGVNLSFDYLDKNGYPLISVLLKPGDCPK